MFKEITIENFQSFKKKTISFCEEVNAIVGLSRSGKTTILRAIRWNATNEPKGDAFQSWWGGDPLVRILFTDGVAVTRKRHKESNFYIIERPGEEDLVLTAFGAKVPEEVSAIFNMDGTNLQGQMDGVFFLSLKPGEVAKQLNQAVNLDIIDTSISSIRKDKGEADKLLKFEKGRVDGIKEKIGAFDYLEGLEEKIKEVEQVVRRQKSFNEQLENLKANILNLESNKALSGRHEKNVVLEADVLKAIKEVEQAVEKENAMHDLAARVNKIETISTKLIAAKALSGASGAVGEAQMCFDEHKLERDNRDLLEKLLNSIQRVGSKMTEQDEKRTRLEGELKEIMPDTCPFCGSPQKEDKCVEASHEKSYSHSNGR